MFVVSVQAHYDSAHYLRNYKGKCEKLHGHRYVVEVALTREDIDPATGITFDFVDVKRALRDVANVLDHENINELEPFTEIEPSSENQARWIYGQMKERLGGELAAAMLYVRVWETPTQWAQYSERTLFV